MSKNIRLNCTVTEFKTEKNRTRVEDYGFKKNELKFEEGIMEINAYDMEMHHLSEGQMRDIEGKFERRPTEYAREMRKRRDNTISR